MTDALTADYCAGQRSKHSKYIKAIIQKAQARDRKFKLAEIKELDEALEEYFSVPNNPGLLRYSQKKEIIGLAQQNNFAGLRKIFNS